MLDKPQLVGEQRSAAGAIGRQLRILHETDGRRKLIGYRRSWRVAECAT
jgi:hypothetical protein